MSNAIIFLGAVTQSNGFDIFFLNIKVFELKY